MGRGHDVLYGVDQTLFLRLWLCQQFAYGAYGGFWNESALRSRVLGDGKLGRLHGMEQKGGDGRGTGRDASFLPIENPKSRHSQLSRRNSLESQCCISVTLVAL